MENLKQQIEELKARIAQIEGMVDRVSEQQITKDYGKFFPKQDQLYYFINSEGYTVSTENDNFEDEIERFDNHNAFPSEQAAEAEAKYTLISRQYRNFARKLNGDWKPDWSDVYKKKYGIEICQRSLEIGERSINNFFIHQVCFKTEAHAQLALEVFGDDLLILCS